MVVQDGSVDFLWRSTGPCYLRTSPKLLGQKMALSEMESGRGNAPLSYAVPSGPGQECHWLALHSHTCCR
jgi:hypothetical protein